LMFDVRGKGGGVLVLTAPDRPVEAVEGGKILQRSEKKVPCMKEKEACSFSQPGEKKGRRAILSEWRLLLSVEIHVVGRGDRIVFLNPPKKCAFYIKKEKSYPLMRKGKALRQSSLPLQARA